ncbi:NusG domain II-containing protein [Fredinandcohnia sp. 179-A 10B2 NHS]|uniref:NusG domain II-containing protein n=1 Tax=Fredinandcohnia sp. 179-A 10B2 NHS TaxID=3235176 RepID=UPI0039A18A4D
MRTYYSMIKRWDIILVISLVLLSFLPFTVFAYQQAGISENTALVAVISVDSKIVKEINLTNNKGTQQFDIKESDSEVNTIEIVDNKIRIKGATCSDQVCVLTGYISKPGETIVCLPHKLVIEIQTVDGQSDDIIISS